MSPVMFGLQVRLDSVRILGSIAPRAAISISVSSTLMIGRGVPKLCEGGTFKVLVGNVVPKEPDAPFLLSIGMPRRELCVLFHAYSMGATELNCLPLLLDFANDV